MQLTNMSVWDNEYERRINAANEYEQLINAANEYERMS